MRHRIVVSAAVVVAALAFAPSALAQSTWNVTTSGSWATAANWSNNTVPTGTNSIADFSQANLTTTGTVYTGGSRTVGSLYVGDTDGSHTYRFRQTAATEGGHTITWAVSSGTSLLRLTGGAVFTEGSWALNSNLEIQVNTAAAIQAWPNVQTANRTLSLTGTGSGVFALNGSTSQINGAGMSVVVDNSGGGALQFAAGISNANYTGSTTIRQGRLLYRTSGANFNSGSGITLGVASGTGNASFGFGPETVTARSMNQPITLAPISSGTLKLIILSATSGVGNYAFGGGVTGSAGFTIENLGDENGTFQTNPLNFSGPLTHTGIGTGLLTINSVIGSNVTEVIQDSATSRMILGGTNPFTGPTTITSGTLSLGTTASLASGTISVASGAHFDVASVTGGFTLGSGQTLGGLGTLAGNTTFDAASFLAFDPNGPLIATGSLTFGSGFGIANLAGVNWAALTENVPYAVVDTSQTFTSASIGNFGPTQKASVSGGREAYFQAGTSGDLELVVVPEPTAIALALGGAAGLGLAAVRRLRRRAG